MRFKALRLNNYKIYYGTQTINFEIPTIQNSPYRKNLVLIGGLNGVGKTTILNAIYYVLFGQQDLSTEEYQSSFTSAINDRFFEEGGREASITLSLQERNHIIQVEVMWSFDQFKKLIHENRTITILDQDGKIMKQSSCTEQEYYDFINKRIPIGIASFFIFDGEKIQQLVEKQDSQIIREAIQRIVSLETYKSLVINLNVLQKSMEKKMKVKSSEKEMRECVEHIRSWNEKTENYQQKLKKWKVLIQQLEEKKKSLLQHRRLKLAQNTASNVEIEKNLARLDSKIIMIDQQLEEFGRNVLPRLILSPLIEKMQKTLHKEEEYMNRKAQEQMKFASYETFVEQLLAADCTPSLLEEQRRQIVESGRKAWANVHDIYQVEIEEREILHDISRSERAYLLGLDPYMTNNIQEIVGEKYSLEKRRLVEEENLRNAPDPVDITEEDVELGKIEQELGVAYARVKQYNMLLSKAGMELTNARSAYTRLRETKSEAQKSEKEYDYIVNIKQAAMEFVEQMTDYKANKLKHEFESILRKLVRKNEDFEKVVFDKKDFVIRIYNDRGSEIRLQDRSAGEKQIIALAFIWALTKTAGISLPFVIDTPLGRLDSIHRSHIIQHYFNVLSDQVIILSTDTEVNAEYIEFMQRYIAQSYELVYDYENKYTKIKEGYFSFL
ncbi:hypothetical protein AM501_20580 [Aneurinibacillus migulanus]|uniref:DNA sulfur modification protein DndD n=1 Tax=Aneurinibacillus migulanus TaxID=47500 RepID=UPI0005B8408F|nr:DNA sulfur modification protein DndD [Aneurinibacillus migulanus]KIV56071.1 hypothetical protein TS64_11370 [Aneurinibacillus migulanus]KPD06595.1 hypothetical protein AM501_20580 [Aneurinibacillus migulanus]